MYACLHAVHNHVSSCVSWHPHISWISIGLMYLMGWCISYSAYVSQLMLHILCMSPCVLQSYQYQCTYSTVQYSVYTIGTSYRSSYPYTACMGIVVSHYLCEYLLMTSRDPQISIDPQIYRSRVYHSDGMYHMSRSSCYTYCVWFHVYYRHTSISVRTVLYAQCSHQRYFIPQLIATHCVYGLCGISLSL